MFNSQRPDPSELPSAARLLRSTGIASAVAGVLLVTVVLPAEYGFDPTGAGSLTGLTEMGRIKMQLASEAAREPEASAPPAPPAVAAPVAAPAARDSLWSDTTTVSLAPDEGAEVKLLMEKGAVARFEWFTSGPKVNYDTHGDGEGVDYHGYEKGRNVERQGGELTAAFAGSHGWFWRNRSGEPLTVTLRTSGDYSGIKVYD